MGEKRAAARGFPLQVWPQRVGVEGNEDEIGLPGEVLGRRFGGLLGSGEVDEAVALVVDRAAIRCDGAGGVPARAVKDFVDQHGRVVLFAAAVSGAFPRDKP